MKIGSHFCDEDLLETLQFNETKFGPHSKIVTLLNPQSHSMHHSQRLYRSHTSLTLSDTLPDFVRKHPHNKNPTTATAGPKEWGRKSGKRVRIGNWVLDSTLNSLKRRVVFLMSLCIIIINFQNVRNNTLRRYQPDLVRLHGVQLHVKRRTHRSRTFNLFLIPTRSFVAGV